MKKPPAFYIVTYFFLYFLLLNTITSTFANCPDVINGFTSLGEYNNHNYYLSQQQAIPVAAQAIAISHGGYLASISTQAENDFIQQHISEMTYIGLNDAQTEGNLIWENGDPVDYQNFSFCGFCYNNSQSMDFTMIHPWDGGWSFSNYWNTKNFIIEIPCEEIPEGSDLSLSNLSGWSGSEELISHDSITISFDIHNNGPQTVLQTYRLKAYLRQVDATEQDDFLVKSISLYNTPFGIVENYSLPLRIPKVPTGMYTLLLVIDETEVVAEFNENNNILTTSSTRQISTGGPYLSLGVSCPEMFPQHGEILSWPITITNTGTEVSSLDIMYLWKFVRTPVGGIYTAFSMEIPPISVGESLLTYMNYPMPTNYWEIPGYNRFSNYIIVTGFNNGALVSQDIDYYCKKTNSDLEISIHSEHTTFNENYLVDYSIQVTNHGPDTAYNVLCDFGRFAYVSSNPLNTEVTGGEVIPYLIIRSFYTQYIWYFDQLAPGTTETLTIYDVDVTSSGLYPSTNSWTTKPNVFSGHSTETNILNNEASLSFSFSESTDCNTTLPGFTFLGAYNNHNYFISNEKANWQTAQNIATANGGYLASFSTFEENNFILNHISDIVLVGGKDENCDGVFEWADGSNTTFPNIINTCSSSDYYTNMNFWNGFLSFDNQWVERKYIMELPCPQNRAARTAETSSETVLAPKLYPNPVFDNLFLELEMEQEENVLLKIYNMAGQEVEAKEFPFAIGINRIKLDVPTLKPGIYFVKVIAASGKRRFKTMRFIKVRD